MTDTTELTVKDYLSQVSTGGRMIDPSVKLQMCELLTTNFDIGTCEGGSEREDMCDIDTSLTFTKSALDWAYQQVTQTKH